jgi:predicted short-subunit dehydrogenase-like oxidoreductase (DUF2520 family)
VNGASPDVNQNMNLEDGRSPKNRTSTHRNRQRTECQLAETIVANESDNAQDSKNLDLFSEISETAITSKEVSNRLILCFKLIIVTNHNNIEDQREALNTTTKTQPNKTPCSS